MRSAGPPSEYPAAAGDRARCRRALPRPFPGSPLNPSPVSDPEFIAAVARSGAVLVAADGGDVPVGFALAGFLDRALHIHELDVAPAHGRRGLGRRLIDAACAFAKTEGALGRHPVDLPRRSPGTVRSMRKPAFTKCRETNGPRPSICCIIAKPHSASRSTDAASCGRIWREEDAHPSRQDRRRQHGRCRRQGGHRARRHRRGRGDHAARHARL